MSPARRGPATSRARAAQPAESPPDATGALAADDVAALEEERDFLLGSLRDLEREREAADIDEGDYQTLRDDYTARAAAVLRALEDTAGASGHAESADEEHAEGGTDVAAPAGDRRAPKGTVPPGAPRRRRAVIGVTIVLIVVVGAGLGVATFTGDRLGNENVSGRGMSETARHVAQAQQLETEGKAVEALKEYDAAIAADAANVVALTYRGWLLGRAGLADRGMASIDEAIAVNPAYPDAHFFRGMLLYRNLQDPAAAVKEFETYLASNPPASAAAAAQGVLDRARNDAANPPPPPPPPPPEATPEPVPDTTVPG
ncbi:MAG: hypothetical protein ACR2HV_01280 [Acidimicrobiales bacterium]